jgi:prepilin-type N-terminal cleavage/methylation domain-containing protein/prepilin-type processing-associated H-X9-DG protein
MNRKAFTLIELLVVIAIIALLVSVVMPALRRAKEAGQRVVCSVHLKSLGTANVIYANEHNSWYVPVYDKNNKNGAHWISNKDFRSYLEMDAFQGNPAAGNYDAPDQLLCPADRISSDPVNKSSQNVLLSYGYNYTDWGWLNFDYAGHKSTKISLPAVKLAFTDSIDWWVDWAAADYARGWDLLGQASLEAYKASPYFLNGPTIYRHSQGANVGFYDGHTEHMNKTLMFIGEDFRAKPRIPGMWVVDMKTYNMTY